MRLRFLEELRDPKPRLKPGFTYFRLIVFLVVALVLAIIAINVATLSYPPRGECEVKGIDAIHLREGTCTEDGSTLVVVDRHDTLKLKTLEAKLIRIRTQKIGGGPGSSAAPERLVSVDLLVTNLTDDPAVLGPDQVFLNAGKPRSEDRDIVASNDPRSLLEQAREIRPGTSVTETASFRVPAAVARGIHKGGNLDLVNFGTSVPASEPEALFTESEYGVIRTYR